MTAKRLGRSTEVMQVDSLSYQTRGMSEGFWILSKKCHFKEERAGQCLYTNGHRRLGVTSATHNELY
jgi:hypothetical protein